MLIVVLGSFRETGGKADVVCIAEGSSSGSAMASDQDTTGVCEQGMQS